MALATVAAAERLCAAAAPRAATLRDTPAESGTSFGSLLKPDAAPAVAVGVAAAASANEPAAAPTATAVAASKPEGATPAQPAALATALRAPGPATLAVREPNLPIPVAAGQPAFATAGGAPPPVALRLLQGATASESTAAPSADAYALFSIAMPATSARERIDLALEEPIASDVAMPGLQVENFLRWLDAVKLSTGAPLASLAQAASPPAEIAGPAAPLLPASPLLIEASARLAIESALPAMMDASLTTVGAAAAATFTLPATSATSASATALPQAPVAMDTPEWPQQLGEQIQWRLGVGIQEARIEISPRELGAVDVRLSVDDSGLRVHLTASNPETRALLQSELPKLCEALQQGGVLLADAQVGRDAPGRQSGRHASDPAASGFPAAPDDESSAPATESIGWRVKRGLLDDYA